jgi:hypothetical protein
MKKNEKNISEQQTRSTANLNLQIEELPNETCEKQEEKRIVELTISILTHPRRTRTEHTGQKQTRQTTAQTTTENGPNSCPVKQKRAEVDYIKRGARGRKKI